jgi:hypothetical protein
VYETMKTQAQDKVVLLILGAGRINYRHTLAKSEGNAWMCILLGSCREF